MSGADTHRAQTIINNWRSSHSFPLNTFQVGLRHKVNVIGGANLVAQRLKRLSSIEQKLRRFKSMKLSQMQDIGGCRAVVGTVQQVDMLRELYRRSEFKHQLVREDDYIRAPKSSGYRGIHLIYRYRSDRKQTYNNLQVEIQLRSRTQHAWATAVETVGTFLQQALKSSQGQEPWLRFFALMGTAIAVREGCTPVPNTPTGKEQLRSEIQQLARDLEVRQKLESYGKALKTLEEPDVGDAHFFLLALDPAAGRLDVTGYDRSEIAKATDDYLNIERALAGRSGAEAVLVSVESLQALRRAYPNYYLDTSVFLDLVEKAIG
jgi:hypothetical protein